MKLAKAKKRFLDSRGWSLAEVLLAISLFTAGVVPFVNLSNRIVIGTQMRTSEVQATLAAQSLVEAIQQKKWDENAGDPPTYVTNRSAIGADLGESDVTQYDDIDDYHNYTALESGGITCRVTVKYMNANLNSAVTESSDPTDYKEIIVSADYNSATKPVVVKTIRANAVF